MKKLILAFFSILFLLAGCGSTHYYTVEDRTVRIYLNEPDAAIVYFASSLNGFEPIKVEKNSDGTWEIPVPSNYEFKYFYIVDGIVLVPSCTFKEQDDFGSQNCIYVPGM